MIPIDDIREVVQQLLQSTKTHQVQWYFDPGYESGRVVYFPHSLVRIIGNEDHEPLKRRIVLEDTAFSVLGEWTVHPNEDGWELLDALHEAACESKRPSDKQDAPSKRPVERILNDIRTSLSRQELAGRS